METVFYGVQRVRVLDLRGEECPIPITKAVRTFAGMGVGEEITILLTSRSCAEAIKNLFESVPSMVRIEMSVEGNVIKLVLKKLGSESPKPSDVSC